MYFLGACAMHGFAGVKSVKMLASPNADNGKKEKALALLSFFPQFKEICHSWMSSGTETITHSVKPANATSTFHVVRVGMGVTLKV